MFSFIRNTFLFCCSQPNDPKDCFGCFYHEDEYDNVNDCKLFKIPIEYDYDKKYDVRPQECIDKHDIKKMKPPKKLIICPECKTEELYVFRSGKYETSVMCPKCGKTECVHSG